ncbi:MAG: shikimate kinase [Candidatus Omnitrophica bacterium]|nr:shikimate kinase [Candidatus Omnitrophota bacterium]
MRNIVLVGFMGTGKTMLAKFLAQDLGMEYISTDDLIEEKENRSINDIFKDSGEEFFRKVEKNVVKEVSERDNCVIDTGGGVVLDENNMIDLKRTGIVVCLWAETRVIFERVKKHGHRPLLNTVNPEDRIKEMLEYRRPFYEKADVNIDTTSGDVSVVIASIKKSIAK